MPTHPIRFGIQTGQQDVTWERMRDFWQKVDAWGYDSLWNFDHFYPIFVPDPTGPCMESWTLLGALSQHTRAHRCAGPRQHLSQSVSDREDGRDAGSDL